MPGVAGVARNPTLSGCNGLVAYATRKLGAAWSGVVDSYAYDITFWKLDIHAVTPISACYTLGRGNSLNRALFGLRPLH